MASRPNPYPPEKPLSQILSEFKDELLEFGETRLTMLRNEMREKLLIASTALQAIAVGAVLALVASLFLCVALVALVAYFLGGGVGAWAAAFALVGFAFLIIGGSAIAFGVWRFRARSIKPERTLQMLKQDQLWLRAETSRTESSRTETQRNESRNQP